MYIKRIHQWSFRWILKKSGVVHRNRFVYTTPLQISLLTTPYLYARCIDWITFWFFRFGILFHFWISIWDSRATYAGGGTLFRTWQTNTSETCSMGDITTMAGHSMTFMSLMCRNLVKQPVWADGCPRLEMSTHGRHNKMSKIGISIPSSINISIANPLHCLFPQHSCTGIVHWFVVTR